MIGERDKVEQSGTFSDDSESDWSLTGDWQRIVSLFIAIAYVVVWPIVFPPKSLSHLTLLDIHPYREGHAQSLFVGPPQRRFTLVSLLQTASHTKQIRQRVLSRICCY